MTFKGLRDKFNTFINHLNISPSKVFPLLSILYGCSEEGTKPDWKHLEVGFLGNKHKTSLLYNGPLFIRIALPFLVCIKIRWSGSTTKKSYLDIIFGWKLNGELATTFRIQSDEASARGTFGPNVNQKQGWKCGTH